MKLTVGTILRRGAYAGAKVVRTPRNGWVRLTWPKQKYYFDEQGWFSVRVHWCES